MTVDTASRSGNWIATCALIFVGAGAASALAGEPTWDVYPITDEQDADFAPHVSGQTYVWQRNTGSGNADILMWSEGDESPVVISAEARSFGPRIAGGRVVWEAHPQFENWYEIELWENGGISRVTDNEIDDRSPDVGAGGIVWLDETEFINFFDGVDLVRIDAVNERPGFPRTDDGFVVWEGGSPYYQIHLWENGNESRLTAEGYHHRSPETDGDWIVWQADSGPSGTPEIWLWTRQDGARSVTNNAVYDVQPDASDKVIVFSRDDGNDFEIFFQYLGVDYQITDNDANDFEPAIDKDRVVWQSGRSIYYAQLHGVSGSDAPGACCLGIDCMEVLESECADAGGEFLGEATFCDLEVCGSEPAAGWSTYRHDPQRTGRTDAVVSEAPVVRWRVFTGSRPGSRYAPSFGVDGTIYAVGENLVAVTPEGVVNWTAPTGDQIGPPSVREDGDLWVGGSKYSHEDGRFLCSGDEAMGPASVIDSTGHAMFASSRSYMVRQLDSNCDLSWEYNGNQGPSKAAAIDPDGGVHVSGRFEFAKLDPVDGSEIWSSIADGATGPVAIGADGTSYRTFEPSGLLATDADGNEQWRIEWDQFQLRIETIAPAIGSDGSIYVVGDVSPGALVSLIKISPLGEEVWRFVGPEDGGGRPPVIDGAGVAVFPAARTLFGIDTTTGEELWRLPPGEEGAFGEPAIAEDGTLYAMTGGGFLVSLGEAIDSCPDPYGTTPPYKYRRLVANREYINQYQIDEIEAFEIATNALLTLQADVVNSTRSAAFVEKEDGSFLSIGPGSPYGGFEIDEAWLPRWDEQGNLYVPATLLNIGHGVFKNGELVLTTGPPPRSEYAPIILHELEDVLFDTGNANNVLIMGRIDPGDPRSVLSFSIASERVNSAYEENSVLERISFTPDQDRRLRKQVSAAANVVSVDGDRGILKNCEMLVRGGDLIDGHRVGGFTQAQINEREAVYFWARDFDGNGGIFHTGGRLVGDGDRIGDYVIGEIQRFEVNNRGSIAYSALLSDGRRAVFVDGEAVAVEGEEVDGHAVDEVQTHLLRYNDAGQVGFVVRSADLYRFYVATPGGEFAYRQVMATDDSLDGMGPIVDFDDIMLGESGLTAADLTLYEARDVAPVRVDDIVDVQHFSRADTGRFTVLARKTPFSSYRVALANPADESAEFLIGVGDSVDGFSIASIRSGEREERLVSDSGQVVLGCRDSFGAYGVLTQDGVVARTADFIDGHRLQSLFLPNITAAGDVYFAASYDLPGSGNAVFSSTQRLIGTGDVVGGHTITEVRNLSVNDAGSVAVFVWLQNASDGLFVDGQPVAVENETMIDGELLYRLESQFVRLNETGQVAFIGTVTNRTGAIYVATPTLLPGGGYTYRRVAEFQQEINGVRLHALTGFRLSDAGLVSIYAQRAGGSNPSKVFRETAEGVFDVTVEGDEIGGLTIQILAGAPLVDPAGRVYQQAVVDGIGVVCFVDDQPIMQSSDSPRIPGLVVETSEGQFRGIVSGRMIGDWEIDLNLAAGRCPRLDADGDAYVFAGVVGIGPTLFRNDQPLVQMNVEGATAPILLDEWGSTSETFGAAASRFVLIHGRRPEDPNADLLLIDADAGTARRVLDEDCLDGWVVEFVESGADDERHAGSGDKTFVVQGDDRTAIVREDRTYVREGDMISGKTLTNLDAPQIVGSDVVFIGEFDGGNGLFTAETSLYSTGDRIGDYLLDRLLFHSSVEGGSAYAARLDDARIALFRGELPLAVPGETTINGALVQSVEPLVRQNSAHQVALLASIEGGGLTAFVASGPDDALTYRRAAAVGDQISGREVRTIDDLRVDEQGLIAFVSRGAAAEATVFREVATGQFDTLIQGDPIADLTVDFTLGEASAPRVTPDGTEVLLLPVRPVGMMLIANRTPLAHVTFDPASDGVVHIGGIERADYLDHDEQGRFVVFGSEVRGQPPKLLLIDPQYESVMPLISEGGDIDGFHLDDLDPARADGFGDDGRMVTRGWDNSQGGAILTADEVLARSGDVIEGRTITNPFQPRRTADGTAYFHSDGVVFRASPDGVREVAREPQAIRTLVQDQITRYSVNEEGRIGYISAMTAGGTNAVFVDDQIVAAAGVTLMFDSPVAEIDDAPHPGVSLNDSGCLAFVGRVEGEPLTLIAACPLAPFDVNGDDRIDLTDYEGFWSCLSGPDDFMPPGCEVFDANDDCHVDLRDAALLQAAFAP